jgi:hypothetical protein
MAAELGCIVEGADGYHHELACFIMKRCARSGGQATPAGRCFQRPSSPRQVLQITLPDGSAEEEAVPSASHVRCDHHCPAGEAADRLY